MKAIRPTNNSASRWEPLKRLLEDAPHRITIATGNGTQWKFIFIWESPTTLIVGIEGIGLYSFSRYAHNEYVKNKLPMTSADACNVADIINYALRLDRVEEQGRYDPTLCEKD